MMLPMPPNDEIEPQSGNSVNNDVVTQAPILHEAGDDPDTSNNALPKDFTFFQKKKSRDDVTRASAFPHASVAQMTSFFARLDSAVASNNKTQRHIVDLQILMADVALTITSNAPKPVRKTLRRSNWWFYVCLAVFGLGWFLLFPTGHNLLMQLTGFLVR